MPNSPVGIIERTFLPNQLPGLAAWFRFGRGIVDSGGAVSRWDDQSGHGRHLIQTTGTNQPALQSDGSILFDGVDNWLQTAAFPFSQPCTIYICFRQVTFTNSDRVFDGFTTSTGIVFQRTTSPDLGMFAGVGEWTFGSLALNAYGACCVVFNGASSLGQLNNNSAVGGSPGAGAMGGFTLGSTGNSPGLFSNIQVKEVILYTGAHNQYSVRAQPIRHLARVGGLTI